MVALSINTPKILTGELTNTQLHTYLCALKFVHKRNIILFIKKNIYLAVLSLSCSMWDLCFIRQDLSCGTESLVVEAQAQSPGGVWDLSSLTRDQTHVPCIGGQILNHWITQVSTKKEHFTRGTFQNFR